MSYPLLVKIFSALTAKIFRGDCAGLHELSFQAPTLYGLPWIDRVAALGYGVLSLDIDPDRYCVQVVFVRLSGEFLEPDDYREIREHAGLDLDIKPATDGKTVYVEVVAPWIRV